MREQELRQRENDLKSKEQELRRAALLDARSLGLEEERLRGVERDLVARLREADAALDALETAQRGLLLCCPSFSRAAAVVVHEHGPQTRTKLVPTGKQRRNAH
jgi:hypothetical protein